MSQNTSIGLSDSDDLHRAIDTRGLLSQHTT